MKNRVVLSKRRVTDQLLSFFPHSSTQCCQHVVPHLISPLPCAHPVHTTGPCTFPHSLTFRGLGHRGYTHMRGFPGLPTQLTFFPPEVWQPRPEAIHTLAQLTPSSYHRTSLIFTLMCLVMYLVASTFHSFFPSSLNLLTLSPKNYLTLVILQSKYLSSFKME